MVKVSSCMCSRATKHFQQVLEATRYLLQTAFTPTPQPLKTGWSQVVKQQTRGTVSAPTSPSKKHPANPNSTFRRETAASSLGRREWTEPAESAPNQETVKVKGFASSGPALAANTGGREALAISSEVSGAREPQSQSSQSPGKTANRLQEGQEVAKA